MVRYRRNFVPGGTYFFFLHGHARGPDVFGAGGSRRRLARSVPYRAARASFIVDAIVILPDHLHAIWTLPPGDSDFSGRWRRIKASFTHRLVASGVPVERHRNGEYALWQRRFWEHTIRNEIDFERHVNYVHFKQKVKTGRWEIVYPRVFRDEDMVIAARRQLSQCDGRPMLMGRSGAAYEALILLTEMAERYSAQATAR